MSRLLLLCALLAALPVRAQITITHADMARILTRTGDVAAGEVAASTDLQTLADRSGPNQTWDFTTIGFVVDAPTPTGPAVLPVPGSDLPALQDANHVIQVGTGDESAYLFFRLADDTYRSLGISSMVDVEGEPFRLLFTFSPGKLLFPLPLTAGASWTSTDTLRMDGMDEFYAVDEVTASVEGWGTVVTPAGSYSALKLRRRTVTTSYLDGVPAEVATDDVIEFITPGDIEVSINLDGTTATGAFYSVFQTTVASASQPDADGLGLTLRSANPARTGARIAVAYSLPSAGDARIEVYDALGRQVAVLLDGPVAADGQAEWRTGALPAGVYAIRLAAGGRQVTERATLVR